MATLEDFEKLDIRVGKIIEVDDHPEARKPGYKLKIDFGPDVGIKNSFSQIAIFYDKKELVDKLVLGVVNFPIRKIGSFESEALVLGVPGEEDKLVLLVPDKENAVVGGKLY